MTQLEVDVIMAFRAGLLQPTQANLELLLEVAADEKKRQRIVRAAHLASNSTLAEKVVEDCQTEGISYDEIAAGFRLAQKQHFDRLVNERVYGAPEYGRKP